MAHKIIHDSPYGKTPYNYHLRQSADHLYVDLTYPPYTDDANDDPIQVRYVVVNQESVRASDGVRLSYDYARDGWVIEQASTFQWEAGDDECDPDWQEVAFVESWAREQKPDFLREETTNDQ